jgi:hypothetical protein
MLNDIRAVDSFLSDLKAEKEEDDYNEYAVMTRRRNKHIAKELNAELIAIHEEMRIQNFPILTVENFDNEQK